MKAPLYITHDRGANEAEADAPTVEPAPLLGWDELLDKEPPLLKARHVAALLGIAERTVRDHARSGKIPCIVIGSAVRFRQDDVRAVMAAHRHEPSHESHDKSGA